MMTLLSILLSFNYQNLAGSMMQLFYSLTLILFTWTISSISNFLHSLSEGQRATPLIFRITLPLIFVSFNSRILTGSILYLFYPITGIVYILFTWDISSVTNFLHHRSEGWCDMPPFFRVSLPPMSLSFDSRTLTSAGVINGNVN